MTPREIYDTKRKNFIEKTVKYFAFLVSENHFQAPTHKEREQANGSIITDQFEYLGQNSTIVILNAYHPVDYGFEINIVDHLSGRSEMVYQVLKEKQDLEQNYLWDASLFLSEKLNND